MKQKLHYLSLNILFILTYSVSAFSQDKSQNFIEKGKFYGDIFGNFHTQINSDQNESAFAIDRASFGYKYLLSENFSINLRLDIGSPNQDSQYDILKRYAYFKNAELNYKKGNLTLKAGIISLAQFKIQENFWGHRYIYKSFQDKHKLGNSGDIGIYFAYAFSKLLSIDFSVMNGEGYHQLQADNTYKGGVGITFKPIKGLTARLYSDFMDKRELQSTIASFIGYQYKELAKIGFEYNYQMNNKYETDHNLYGFSTYASYNINKKWETIWPFR